MNPNKSLFEQFFGVIARGQTWLNFLYLFLAFPLGLIYFIYLTVGISVGIGTIIIWIGILILAVVIAGWWLMAGFERVMAISLLKVDIPPMSTEKTEKAGTSLEKLGAYLSNPVTWKGLVYLLVKFPLGTLSFVVLVTLTATTVAFIAAPFIFPFFPMVVDLSNNTSFIIDTLAEASILFVIGLVLLFVSLHIFNGLAWVSGQFAKVMLGNPRSAAQPTPITVAATPVEPVTPAMSVESVTPAEPELTQAAPDVPAVPQE
jgi:hypothetical protein